jgi:hypothetical protein
MLHKRSDLKSLYVTGASNRPRDVILLNKSGEQNEVTLPTFGTVTEELRDWIAGEIVKTDLEVIKAQAALESKQAASQGENDQQYRQSLGELKLNVASLLRQREHLAKYFAQLKVVTNAVLDNTVETTFVSHQLDCLLKSDDQLRTTLEELEFKSEQEAYRVTRVDAAVPPKVPTNTERTTYTLAAPIAVFVILIGLFLLIPIKDEPLSQSAAKQPSLDELGR